MKAILSDIHGNLEALRTVLDDAASQGADLIYNLGNIVGYGPDPLACIDLSMEMALVLQGNVDHAIFLEKRAFPKYCEQSMEWTLRLLEAATDDVPRIEFLRTLPASHKEKDVMYVHGSPSIEGFATGWEALPEAYKERPNAYRNEYLYPDDIHNRPKMRRMGAQLEHVCFNGNTHIPGIFLERGPEDWRYLSCEECGNAFTIDKQKVICNVGSVGQPHDGDWRAGYALFDGATVSYRRVEYDIEATIAKIYAVPELGQFTGDRLRAGR